MTKQFMVLSSPIAHSKSPAIHQAAYQVLGLDWQYGRREVVKNDLRQVLDSAPPEIAGFSLTMPLKEEAARHASGLDEFVASSGVANTLVRTNDGWQAYNTDVYGIYRAISLASSRPVERLLILGSGATAFSTVMAAKYLGANVEVQIFARNAQARARLLAFAQQIGLQARVTKRLTAALRNCDFTVSTLPPRALDDVIRRREFWIKRNIKGGLLDVAYDPWPSAAALLWQAAGAQAISGFEMLLWQAVAQIRIFLTGNPNEELPNEVAVVEAMRHSV